MIRTGAAIPRLASATAARSTSTASACTTSPRTRCSSRWSISAPASTTWQHEPATRAIMAYDDGRRDATPSATSCRARRTTGGPSAAPPTRCWRRSAASSPASATRRSARCGRCSTARTCSTRSIRSSPTNIRNAHRPRCCTRDPFHVSANTDPEGRPLQAAAGAGPGHAAACGQGDRRRHRRARRQIRDGGGLCQPGVHQADHRQLGRRRLFRLCGRLHLRSRLARPEIHLPHRVRRPRAGRRLSAVQPLRRGRYARHLRRRADPVGERAVLPPHQGGDVHPRHAAPLLGVRVRAAQPQARRHDDRRGAVQRAADRARQAAGGAGEAGRSSRCIARASTRISRRRSRSPSQARAGC